jgi:trigger factor
MGEAVVATRDLYVGIHRAHVKGDRVPAENVKRNGWESGVAAEGSSEAEQAQASEVYDPGAYSIDDVAAYLETASPEERAAVLQRERDGKARKGLVG